MESSECVKILNVVNALGNLWLRTDGDDEKENYEWRNVLLSEQDLN